MTQLALPNTIDAATEITASEHQQNYEAIRDVINGQIEGGSGVDGNLKADGVTAREIENSLLLGLMGDHLQEGVMGSGDGKVTPGAGLNLSVAAITGALVRDASGILSTGSLIRVSNAGGSLAIGANASGNPRIDQIILTMTGWNVGTISVLAGTASVGATLANRTGAAALPSNAIRLADILMPSGFAGPFVQNTHIRDRRQWARGAFVSLVSDGSSATTTASATPVALAPMTARLEIAAGNQLEVTFQGFVSNSVAASTFFTLFQDGVEFGNTRGQTSSHAGGNPHWFTYSFTIDPGDGSREFAIAWWASGGGTITLTNASNVVFRATFKEILRPNVSNTGA